MVHLIVAIRLWQWLMVIFTSPSNLADSNLAPTIQGLVICIDYCSVLDVGLHLKIICKLQVVKNAAAHLLFRLPTCSQPNLNAFEVLLKASGFKDAT